MAKKAAQGRGAGAPDPLNGKMSVVRRADPPTPRDEMAPATAAPSALHTMPFGKQLAYFRMRASLSQTELATRIGRSTSLISLLESGARRPTAETASQFANALALSEIERMLLSAAAGVSENQTQDALKTVVDVVAAASGCDEQERSVMLADLTAQVNGWQRLLTAAVKIREGAFGYGQEALTSLGAPPGGTSPALATATAGTTMGAEPCPPPMPYAPILFAQINAHAAELATHLGKLDQAQRYIQQSQRILKDARVAEPVAQRLRAEADAHQAMIWLRQGLYREARTMITRSEAVYDDLLAGSHTPREEDMACLGLGMSYKRLAQVALLEGKAAEAYKYVITAQAFLSKVQASKERDRWRRRTLELKAWALAELGDFEESKHVREQVLQLCEQAGDDYGVTKNLLYRGDDCRRQLQRLLQDVPVSDDVPARRAALRARLQGAHVNELLDEAEDSYARACDRLKAINQRILLGRCLRGLGIILRYRAIHAGEAEDNKDFKEYYGRAEELMHEALQHDQRTGQSRRLPAIYESLAELEWDRGHLRSALSFFQTALNAAAYPQNPAPDPASDTLIQRVTAQINVLRRALDTGVPLVVMSQPPKRWADICRDLLATIRTYLTAHRELRPLEDNRDPAWLEAVLRMEESAAPRLLAQNGLSHALAPEVPDLYPSPNMREWADKRHQALLDRVTTSRDVGYGSPRYDLCCRAEVEGALDVDLRPTLKQLETAAHLMDRYPRGYELHAAPFSLPFFFSVAGESVLLKVPPSEVTPSGGVMSQVRNADTVYKPRPILCYIIERDTELAGRLSELFDQLLRAAHEEERGVSSTPQWIGELIERAQQVLARASEGVLSLA